MRVMILIIPTFLQISLCQQVMEIEIAAKLHHAKDLICNTKHPVFIYHQQQLSHSSESILNSFLTASPEPLTILTNKLNPYRWSSDDQPCLLLFLDGPIDEDLLPRNRDVRWDPQRGYIERAIRMLVVTPQESFDLLKIQFLRYQMHRSVYMIFSQSQYTFYHYNVYLEQFQAYPDLQRNPWVTANRDLTGNSFKVKLADEQELEFTKFVLRRLNGTLDNSTGKYWMHFEHFSASPFLYYRFFYIHRVIILPILVPRLNTPKPLIAVLLDPFDVATWISVGSMMVAMSVLKMCYSRVFSIPQFLNSLLHVLENALLGTCTKFYRKEEKVIVGMFLMANVVIMTAYESMVTSFLLNPRYFPELDTPEQLLKSCCWVNLYRLYSENDSHICRADISVDLAFPVKDEREKYICFVLNPRHATIWDAYMHNPTIEKEYRWSKSKNAQSPVVGMASGGIGLDEQIRFYAGVFFAEGALYQYFERPRNELGAVINDHRKPVRVQDLSLLWISLVVGIVLTFVVFICEHLVTYYNSV